MGGNKGIVGEVGVGGDDAVDLLALAGVFIL